MLGAPHKEDAIARAFFMAAALETLAVPPLNRLSLFPGRLKLQLRRRDVRMFFVEWFQAQHV